MAQAKFVRQQAVPADWTWIEVSGDLDIASSPRFDYALLKAIWARPHGHLLVDLSRVTFLDCAGARPLIRARGVLQDRFWLASPAPPVARLFHLAGLATEFAVLDGVTAASLSLVPSTRGTGPAAPAGG